MMQIDFPYHMDLQGRTATTSHAGHVRDLIEQVLFTAPGERVNRPELGSGLLELVFAPNSPELATATQFLIQGSLQQWLGDRISVEAVDVSSQDATLRVTVQYVLLATEERRTEQFQRDIPA